MRYVTLINRSSKVLTGTWDGKREEIQPGKNSYPELKAIKFKEQNPIMGTENPYTLDREYLCGIEEYSDPIDPVEQSTAIERFNRALLTDKRAQEVEIVTGNTGLYGRSSVVTKELPTDGTGFVTPNK